MIGEILDGKYRIDKHLGAGPFTPTYPGSAGANDLYWCFVLDPQLGGASDLTAMNIVPGQTAEVHHVIVFRDPGGQGSAGQPASARNWPSGCLWLSRC